MPEKRGHSTLYPIPDGDISVGFLVGHRVTEINSSAAPGSWVFRFDNQCGLTVEGTWRIIKNGQIVISGNDHGQIFGLKVPVDAGARALDALGSAVIQRASCAEATGDLHLEFENAARFDVLVDSCGYESWQLSKPDGTGILASGSGVTAFGPRAG